MVHIDGHIAHRREEEVAKAAGKAEVIARSSSTRRPCADVVVLALGVVGVQVAVMSWGWTATGWNCDVRGAEP
jgi:hypothetical protein